MCGKSHDTLKLRLEKSFEKADNPTAKGTRRSKPDREDMKRSEMAYNILRHIGIRPYPGKPTRYCTA